jgi:phosphatidylinositol alpha-mannosyltransferase
VTTLQLSAWGLQTLAAYVLLFALHLHVAAPLATAAAILIAVNVTAAVPLTPSNLGIFQAACVGILAGAGIGSGPGLAYGLLLQATEIVTALALGLPAAAVEFVVSGGRAGGGAATTRR